MKRLTLWTAAGVILFLSAFVIVRADTRKGHAWCDHLGRHSGPMSCLVHELKLSDAQREQIRTLWNVERPGFSADIHELLVENKEMNAAALTDNSDQDQMQKIADREANTIARLLVDKVHLQSKIYSSVLSPGQRAKADELMNKWESHFDRFADRLGTQPAQQ